MRKNIDFSSGTKLAAAVQQIHKSKVAQQIHNKSNKWSLGFIARYWSKITTFSVSTCI